MEKEWKWKRKEERDFECSVCEYDNYPIPSPPKEKISRAEYERLVAHAMEELEKIAAEIEMKHRVEQK